MRLPLLRREVELPLRPHERVSFYMGIATLALGLLILLDAALCSHPAARPAARAPAAARIARTRCADAARLRADAARLRAAVYFKQAEFRRQVAEQLEHPWAAADDLDAGGRYGTMNQVGADQADREPSLRRHAERRTRAAR